ncbi:MAG: cytochrome P450, partial [Acidimicrobiaceae bacterium]|nr:cytochrome P450 [Acidimicrobiaceae bacterium]
MQAGSSCPVQFDHHAAAFAADPWTPLRVLRETCPVAYTESHGGFWIITSYAEIREIASDDIRFSSAKGLTIAFKTNPSQRSIPAEVD